MADLTPITRSETFMDDAAKGSTEGLPTPITREEKYFAKAAGMDIEVPKPVTRKEIFENALAKGGGGSATVKTLTYTGTGSDTNTIEFPDTPTVILSIDGMGLKNGYVSLSSFRFGSRAVSGLYFNTENTQSGEIRLRAAVNGNSLTLSMGADAGAVCNVHGESYTVAYI